MHVQPLPLALEAVKTLGRESESETVPLVELDASLVAVMEYSPAPPGAKPPVRVTDILQEPLTEELPLAPPQPVKIPAADMQKNPQRNAPSVRRVI